MKDKSLLRVRCPKCGTSYKRGERYACAEQAPSPPREPLLACRERTHGSYAETSRVAQELKRIIHRESIEGLILLQRESLDMIATKIARILCGDAYELDHWKDISGYALLVVEQLTPPASSEPPR